MPSAQTPSRPWYDRPLPLGTVARIPVAVSTSWFLITVGMVAVFAPSIRDVLPYLGWVAAAGVALLYALILAISVLLHEVAHAVAARAMGWKDSRIEITLWGGHTSFEADHPTPGQSVLVSVVGPAVNLILGGLGFALVQILHPTGVADLLLYMAVWSNLAVGVFNLLPGLPLDGGRIVESIGWKITGSQGKGTVAAGWAGRIVVLAIAAFLAWQVLVNKVDFGLFTLALLAVVLVPLWTGAGSSIKHGRLRTRLEGMSAQELISPVTMLPAGSSVAGAEAAGVYGRTVVLAEDPSGAHLLRILPEAVDAVPPQLRAGTPVTQAGVLADDGVVLPPTADGDAIARAALASVSGTVLVVDSDGRCIGAVRREDVIAAIEGRVRKEIPE